MRSRKLSGWRSDRCRPVEDGEQGAALILVLWVSALLGLVLTGFAFSMRVETDAAKNFRDHAQTVRLAESGITLALADLANRTPSGVAGVEAAPVWPVRLSPRFPSGRAEVVVTSEDSKICLNHASETVLRRLLQQTGVQDATLQDTIAAAIVDWRDADEVERPNGAESAYYRDRPVPHASKNAPFQRVDELLSVRGMTRDILYGNIQDSARRDQLLGAYPDLREFASGEYLGVAGFLTAHGSGRIDNSLADADVLTALEIPQIKVLELLAARETAIRNSIPKLLHLEASGRLDRSPIAARIVAVVAKEGTPRAPRYRVVAWQEQEG
jgi:Tfp pilus assembly protein PilX